MRLCPLKHSVRSWLVVYLLSGLNDEAAKQLVGMVLGLIGTDFPESLSHRRDAENAELFCLAFSCNLQAFLTLLDIAFYSPQRRRERGAFLPCLLLASCRPFLTLWDITFYSPQRRRERGAFLSCLLQAFLTLLDIAFYSPQRRRKRGAFLPCLLLASCRPK